MCQNSSIFLFPGLAEFLKLPPKSIKKKKQTGSATETLYQCFLSMEGGRWEKLNGRRQKRKRETSGEWCLPMCFRFFFWILCCCFSSTLGTEQNLSEIKTTQREQGRREGQTVKERQKEKKGGWRKRVDKHKRVFLKWGSLKVKNILKAAENQQRDRENEG